MSQCRDRPADKIKQDEAKFSQNILNIVAKNPEVKHVSSEMSDSRVQKHGGVKGRIGGNWTVDKLVGNESIVCIKHAGVDRQIDPINKHDDVQCQKKKCEYREVFCGILVF